MQQEFVVREAVYDGNVLQAVVAVRGKENRRAVMLGDDGNVSADAVLVDVGEDGEIETAREEDGVLLVYIRQEMRTAENELHVVWPCFCIRGGRGWPELVKPADGYAGLRCAAYSAADARYADADRIGACADADAHRR